MSLLWLHHLRQGDYARWFRIKDEALAAEAENIQRHHADDPAESRTRLRKRSNAATRHQSNAVVTCSRAIQTSKAIPARHVHTKEN